ncbi:hypothetical protein AB7M47_008232 [Bradyrhizobium elkanii]
MSNNIPPTDAHLAPAFPGGSLKPDPIGQRASESLFYVSFPWVLAW